METPGHAMSIEQALRLALQCQQAGRLAETERLCRQILAAQPNCAGALNLLGIVAAQVGRADVAAELMRRAVRVEPGVPEYQSNLGNVLRATGDVEGAIAAYQAALRQNPKLAEVHANLGCALARKGKHDDAIAAFERAIALKPSLAEAHSNLGNALIDLGRVEEAIAAYRAAAASGANSAANDAEVQCNLGMALLLHGEFAEGWRAYEWRTKCGDSDVSLRQFAQPIWDGGELAGKTILLHAEQGLGDTIQFIRYAKPVAQRGGKVVVACQRELVQLLSQLPYVSRWAASDEAIPAADVHYPLLSLPLMFGTTGENIPAQDPPLRARDDLARHWRNRMSGDELKVGLAWAGSAGHKNDVRRSITASLLAPLGKVAGARFFSLQKTPGRDDSRPGFEMVDWTAEWNDFADTAGLVENLDLVISVDTSVAHLAGAMNKPTWVLLPFAPDWRWGQTGLRTPWYPAMRLFRQTRMGDWAEVIQRVRAELVDVRQRGAVRIKSFED